MNDPTDVLAIHILSSLYPMIGDSYGMVLHAPLFFLVRLNLPHVVLLGHRGRLRQPDGGLPRADAAGPWLQRVGEGTAFDKRRGVCGNARALGQPERHPLDSRGDAGDGDARMRGSFLLRRVVRARVFGFYGRRRRTGRTMRWTIFRVRFWSIT